MDLHGNTPLSRGVLYSETSDKGQSKRGQTSQQRTSRKYSCICILYRISPLKEDNLSTKDKMAGPESVLIKRLGNSPSAQRFNLMRLAARVIINPIARIHDKIKN